MKRLNENENLVGGSDGRGMQKNSKIYQTKKLWKFWEITTILISVWKTRGNYKRRDAKKRGRVPIKEIGKKIITKLKDAMKTVSRGCCSTCNFMG